ncbi:MAG: hypothetical protein J0H34_07105 [Rhizobiales bacterium]|nr:hypothetical protein [Hyphomicrobiales bacterium]
MMRVAWGKTDPEKRPPHRLIHHSMDVAAVLERLVRNPTAAGFFQFCGSFHSSIRTGSKG